MLATVASASVGLVIMAVTFPVTGDNLQRDADGSPELSAELTQQQAARLANFETAAGVDTTTGVLNQQAVLRYRLGRSSQITVATLPSAAELDYDLDQVSSNDSPVPRVFATSLPDDLHQTEQVDQRKEIFFKTVLPLVLQVNDEIEHDRQRLWSLHYNRAMGLPLSNDERRWLNTMAETYGTKPDDIAQLLHRVDVIPVSLAMAQAAEESGWGRSRFARHGNALFGQWTYNEANGIIPTDREDGKTHAVRKFPHLLESVRAYARNLNKHRAYREFRKARAEMRRSGESLDGYALAGSLIRYSERGEAYVDSLRLIMRANDLSSFEQSRLRKQRAAAKPQDIAG